MAVRKLFMIDSMAMIYRSYFSLGGASLTTRDGRPTSAVYGSAMFLAKLIQEEKPDYLLPITDSPEPTFRHEMYPEYKANRDEMPDELSVQIPIIESMFEAMGMPWLRMPGIEADDIIGTIAKKLHGPNLEVYIVSGDKDFMQLVNDNIFLYIPKKNEPAHIVNKDGVFEKFRCPPRKGNRLSRYYGG